MGQPRVCRRAKPSWEKKHTQLPRGFVESAMHASKKWCIFDIATIIDIQYSFSPTTAFNNLISSHKHEQKITKGDCCKSDVVFFCLVVYPTRLSKHIMPSSHNPELPRKTTTGTDCLCYRTARRCTSHLACKTGESAVWNGPMIGTFGGPKNQL